MVWQMWRCACFGLDCHFGLTRISKLHNHMVIQLMGYDPIPAEHLDATLTALADTT